jgi:putative endonuclease
MPRTYFVYILASESRELYTGVTNDLPRRLAEHRSNLHPEGYAAKHNTKRLVYAEATGDVHAAIRREKQIKADFWPLRCAQGDNLAGTLLHRSPQHRPCK